MPKPDPFRNPDDLDRYRLLSAYFRNLVDTEWPDAIGKMKQFACYFTHGVPNGSVLRRDVHTARTPAEILDRVDSFFADTVNAGGSFMTAATATNPALERRRERRVPVHLPMLVRGTDRTGSSFEERTSSENLCRGGAAFATRYALDLGSQIRDQYPASPSAGEPDTEFSTHGRIVHLAPGKNERESIVGVEFTGPRFHRMFVSESTS